MQSTQQQQMMSNMGSKTQLAAGNPNSGDDQQDAQDAVEVRLSEALKKAQADAEKFTKNDQYVKRKDTVEVVIDILNRIKAIGEEINKMTQDMREKLYYLTFNATVIVFRLTHTLRMANFSKEATTFLAFNVLCLDNNLILTTAKYLDWRVLNYLELGRAYADIGAYKAAIRVISYGIQKVLYLKQIEEQDPPVPDGTKETLVEALRILRTQELKYQLQSGILSADAWKKKIEETFNQNKYHRSLAIVECLATNDPNCCRQVQRSAKNLQIKTTALKLCLDFVKADIELVKQALIQIHEKKKRDRDKKEQLMNKEADINVDELLEKYKALDQEMIKEKDWKFASYNVPIEVHVELLKGCFECKLWPEFDMLLDPALVRLKFRRYEVPYLATVDVLMSASKQANIPNGFEKIPKDLNAANLRIELKRLRAQAKMTGGDSGAGGKSKEEDKKKEDAKKQQQQQQQPPVKPDPKGKKPDPKAQQQQQEIPKDEEDEQQIMASEAELEKIKHIYVNLLLQRTKNSQNAIVGVDVILADENHGPDLPDNHFAVAVPIRQHQGIYEKTKLIPYIVFRRTANSLIDEEDCLSIVTDVAVVMGQDAHLRAPLGYHKIPIDLRQTPHDLERVPNLDYVYVCYKTDKQLAITERDLLVFRRLADLEKSYLEKTSPEYKQLEENRQFMNLNFNMEMLVDLARTIKEALLGPLGDFYLEQRQDILFDITCLLWSKYLLPTLQRVDVYVEMRHQKEYNGEMVENLDEMVIQIKHHFVEAFNVMHRILTRMNFVEDMVMYTKFAIYLACFQEELGEFRNAVQTLRSALGKIVEYREERLKQSLDYKENVKTSMSISIDNKKIGELEAKIAQVYDTWEQLILRKERDRERRENENFPLDEDEGDEEQLEVQQCIDELINKDLFEKNINIEEWRKTMRTKNQLVGVKYFNEQEQIIHSLHGDLLVNLYRCEIKLGREMQVVKNQTNKLLISQGIDLGKNAPGNLTKNLSASLNQKMNQAKNKTLAKSKGDLTNLKQTLQEAGKLPPPKPEIKSNEKILERENNHNPYQNALLHMCLAVAKSNIVEQKSLLLEALEFLKKAKQQEDSLTTLAIENAIYIKAGQHYHDYYGRSADQVHPFNLMAKSQYIKKTATPAKPIMICRTSTSIVMKLPFYRPITEYKSWRNIGQMALFGKPSGSGVGVSLNNTEYDGTGDKRPPGAVVKVTGLVPNEKYVFAAGGYTGDGICVNGIGETSNEITALLPLSMHQLYGYLAEISFKLGHYQIAKQAAETLCSQFIEKNEYKYSFLDTRINPILAFRLNYDYLSLISPIEAKQLAESFLILARVSKIVKSDIQKRADSAELKVEKQKIDMKIANYLLLALDIALSSINQPVLLKRLLAELFNHMLPYFAMHPRPHLLQQVLFKCHQAARQVPQELIDANLRKILGCMSYQLLRMGFEQAEEEAFRRVMISELPMNTRRWRKYIQYLIRRPQLPEELKLKKEEQEKRIQLGEKIAEADLVKEIEPYEEKVTKVEEFEVEGGSLEEFMLSLVDYQDVVKAKLERWKLQINRYQKQASNGNEVVEKLKEGLVQLVEFWEGIKLNNPGAQLQQIIVAFDAGNQNARYLEFCCKCVRRSMELGLQPFTELEEILANKIKVAEDVIASIENKLAERLEYLEKDIVRKQRRRFNILEEKVKQLQEQQAISGGNKATNLEKIQSLMDNAEMDEDDYWGIIQFDTDEEERSQVFQYLWISEKVLLQGMCQFLSLALAQPQRNQLQITVQGCVFNDVLQLDFNKYKVALDEHNDKIKHERQLFEEEHKKDNEKFVLKIEERVKKVTAFLKIMSRAAEYAKNARAWLQLENILRYTWNAFSYDYTTPLELKETEAWKYVVLLSEASLYLIEYLKGGGTLRKVGSTDIDQVKSQRPTMIKEPVKSVAFKIEEDDNGQGGILAHDQSRDTVGTSKSGAMGPGGKGLKWFEKIPEFDISIHANFITFGVQCLMSVKRWESLVDLSNRLNFATENTYAQYLLPFIIYAQTTLFNEAAYRTNSRRNDLQVRIQQFENWKLTNKKKRSRQAMITGEIPPEEQEFLRDKGQLEKEIFRLEIIESILNSDKTKSEQLLENIKRDANNCEESLKQCRKLYFQFGIETSNLRQDELRKGQTHFEIKAKRKGHKVYTSMVISNYKKCIELLRKRQEKFLLIQSLHELGNLLYADGQLGEAEIQWNDCIDTIFQKLYVVNSFRQVFKDNPQLSDAFGSRECLIGAIVLTKLSKLCYEGKDLFRYTECLLMAADLFAAPAKLSFPHPQIPIEYSSYRMREFMTDQLFVDKYILSPSEILHTIGAATQALIDADLFEKALPLATLMEYMAMDISKSKLLTVKARTLKAIALLEIGYINEAYQLYNRLLSQKDLPKIGVRESEFTQKKDGKNFYFPYAQRYYNNLPPEHEKNNEAIQNILKVIPVEVLTQFKKNCSPYVVELLQYLRCMMLIRIAESENVEAPEKADLRLQLLRASDDTLRNSTLKNLQMNEEINYCKDRLEQLVIKEIDIPEVEISDLKMRLAKCFETNAISEEDQKNFYSNKEEEMCYADRRTQFLSLILRARMAIARIQQKQGLLLQSFYILRQALHNFKQLAEGKHSKVETGQEAEDKGTFKLPEIYGGSGLGLPDPKQQQKPGAAGGKQPPAQEQKKPAGGKGAAQQQQQDEEELKKQEEERKKREADEELKEKSRVEAAEKRDHPHIYLWLKIKVEIINILFHQKRYEDCADAIAVTKMECQSVNDLFFARQLMEFEFMMEVYMGELEGALKTAEKIRKHAGAYNHTDMAYANFLGNLSEFMYNKDKRVEANEAIKEGRLLAWYRLRDFGLDLDPQNFNARGEVKVNKARQKPNEEVLAQFQTAVPQPGAKGGAQAKPPAQAKPGPGGKGAPAVPDDLPVEEEKVEPPLDFNQKIEYPLVMADNPINSSYQEPNIYLRHLESAVRFDIRYAQYLTMLEKKHDLARKVLQDSEKLIRRTLHISPQLKFYVHYLLGHTNLQIFYDKVLEFQGQYAGNKKYKEPLAKHIPYGGVALGQYMIQLPNFSEKLKKFYKDYLEWAKKSFKSAIDVAKNESIAYEFDFNVVDALRELSECSFLIMEYRVRCLQYKYARYQELDLKRKIARKIQAKRDAEQMIDDNLLEEEIEKEIQAAKDDWEEQKINKEKLEVVNAKRQTIHFLEICINMSKALREFQDKQHVLGQVNLTDPSKIPREIAWELFEAFQVTKVNYVKIPDFDPKDKMAITSSELVGYLKALTKELEFMTFGEEKQRQSKLISKLHRYLKMNLASYVQRCSVDIKEPDEVKDPIQADTLEVIQKAKVLSKWFDFKGQQSSLYYILGPIDDQLLSQIYPIVGEQMLSEADILQREELRKDAQSTHIGKVNVDPLVLSALYQEVRDLIDKMRVSEKMSPAQNERDKRGYRVKFDQLIERFGNFFKPPIINEEQGEHDVNCFDLILDILPDLTIDNVEKLAQILQKDSGCVFNDPKLNTIFKRFHRLRYAK